MRMNALNAGFLHGIKAANSATRPGRGPVASEQACENYRTNIPSSRTSFTMRICVFGSGAVGSHFAVRLALAGHDVSCVMRDRISTQ